MSEKWQEIAARKKSLRASLIPSEWILSSPPSSSVLSVLDVPRTSGILTSRELDITSLHDATSLAAAIRRREYSAEEVTRAFCKRAAIAQQVCNCLTEIMFEEALERARCLDRDAREGRWWGRLHGVPVSLKDTFWVKGVDSSIGIASLAEKPDGKNAPLVNILLDAGAVIYCKTNVPQTLMALDSENNIFGRTLNPRNRAATAGGSSGGEGALIAMRGSILGIGTDVGGSIRIPAMCNGLYGIKPSAQRVPYLGQENGTETGSSKIGLPASAGPIATSSRDCELVLKVVAEAKPWEQDPTVVYGKWMEQGELEKKPIFGVVRTDGLVTPLPPIAKVLEETVEKLKRAGYEVVEMETPLFKKCQSLANAFFGIDGGNHMFDLLEATGEPLTTWLSTRLRRKQGVDLKRLVKIHAQRMELEREMLKIWKTKDGRTIDAFICPVAPHPVPPIDRWNGVSYTSSFVLLDYPAATLPVRDFIESDLKGQVAGDALSSWDKVNRELWTEKTIDRKVYLNTKLSVQVVAPKLQEYRLCRAMEAVDKVLHQSSHARAKL